jgi:hypothetical protein
MKMRDETMKCEQGPYKLTIMFEMFLLCVCYIYAMNYHKIDMSVCLHHHQTHNV